MVLWCIKSFGKKAVLAQIGDVSHKSVRLCYVFLVILPVGCSFNNPPKVEYTDLDLTVLMVYYALSVAVLEKLRGQKSMTQKMTKKKNMNFWTFSTSF